MGGDARGRRRERIEIAVSLAPAASPAAGT
jgi:hypothetical protein